MGATEHLKTRVSLETKRRVQAAAQMQLLTESIWLRQAIDAALRRVDDGSRAELAPQPRSPSKRLYVRLRPDDVLLLRERAMARGMPAATYLDLTRFV